MTPVAGATITARYGETGQHWANYHDGLDFAAPSGTPIRAATAGRVVSRGYVPSYGLRTIVRHAPGFETHYCHQSAALVAPGTEVGAGQVIGRVGTSGNVTGPHLHFMVVVDGQDKDPAGYLSGATDIPTTPEDATLAGASAVVDGLGLDAGADSLRRLVFTLAIVAGGLGLIVLGLARGLKPITDEAKGAAADVALTVTPAGRGAAAAGAASKAGGAGGKALL